MSAFAFGKSDVRHNKRYECLLKLCLIVLDNMFVLCYSLQLVDGL